MPTVEVHILEGYADDEKSRLGRALTDAVRFVVPAPPEAVTVMIHEMKPAHYMRGGEHRTGAPALPDPCAIVRSYLSALEARDLATAKALLAEDFFMIFPGTPPMHRLEELIEWAASRYRFVTKTYDGFDAFQGQQGAVVYAYGTLSGQWPDGAGFSDIRFIDRFELTDAKITRQDVWNDIAEVKSKGLSNT
jgi:4-oxalocrotonate tautomerase family enzyme